MNHKTKYIIPFLALVLLVPLGLADAQIPLEQEESNETSTTIERINKEERSRQFDALMETIDILRTQNIKLSTGSSVDDETVQATIARNNEIIEDLYVQVDIIWPPLPVVEVSDADRAIMEDVMMSLVLSGLPLYYMAIDSSTGKLNLKIDEDRATLDTGPAIWNITGNIPLMIEYGTNKAVFQSACPSGTQEYCNPLVGGAMIEEGGIAMDCTISIGAKRSINGVTERGIVIPDHCNPETVQIYQPAKTSESNLVGNQTKNGGWFCDCDFIKSDSRVVSTNKVAHGTSDVLLSGSGDGMVNEEVVMYGSQSGRDYVVTEVNIRSY